MNTTPISPEQLFTLELGPEDYAVAEAALAVADAMFPLEYVKLAGPDRKRCIKAARAVMAMHSASQGVQGDADGTLNALQFEKDLAIEFGKYETADTLQKAQDLIRALQYRPVQGDVEVPVADAIYRALYCTDIDGGGDEIGPGISMDDAYRAARAAINALSVEGLE